MTTTPKPTPGEFYNIDVSIERISNWTTGGQIAATYPADVSCDRYQYQGARAGKYHFYSSMTGIDLYLDRDNLQAALKGDPIRLNLSEYYG